MKTFHPRRVLGIAAALVLTAATAQAQGKGHGHGNGNGKGHDKGGQELRTDDRDIEGRVIDRGGYDVGRYDQGRRIPPGLAKKPGGMPPGQYKKRYSTSEGSSILRDVLGRRGYPVLRTTNAGESQYVYYRTPDGSVRRAVVSQGSDQVRFGNLPSSLMREVLGRLY